MAHRPAGADTGGMVARMRQWLAERERGRAAFAAIVALDRLDAGLRRDAGMRGIRRPVF